MNVTITDKRRLTQILEDEVMSETWQFEMAKFILYPSNIGDTLQNVLKKHYPLVERNIFNMPMEEAQMYFDLVRGDDVKPSHCRRL